MEAAHPAHSTKERGRRRELASREHTTPSRVRISSNHHRSTARIGLTDTAARSDPIMKKHNALARRLLDRQDDYLRFTQDLRIPPDNNGSERDIRMIKLRQKVSGCLRTLTGAKQISAAISEATCPPLPNMAGTSSTPSSCSPRGLATRPHLTSYVRTARWRRASSRFRSDCRSPGWVRQFDIDARCRRYLGWSGSVWSEVLACPDATQVGASVIRRRVCGGQPTSYRGDQGSSRFLLPPLAKRRSDPVSIPGLISS